VLQIHRQIELINVKNADLFHVSKQLKIQLGQLEHQLEDIKERNAVLTAENECLRQLKQETEERLQVNALYLYYISSTVHAPLLLI